MVTFTPTTVIPTLDYEPVVLVSTDGLPRDEWLQYRRLGIGGSEVAACQGLSPFTTMRDLYMDKMGFAPAIPDDDNWVAKEIGNRLEDLVAEMFAQRTGLTVFKVKVMYRHPMYPYMIADVDYFVLDAHGNMGVLEIKTSHYFNRILWDNNRVPYHYACQGRHYMSVMNLGFCYFACLFGNSMSDLEIRYLPRDFAVEEEQILDIQYFWNTFLMPGIPPPYDEDGERELKRLKNFYGRADTSLPALILPTELEKLIAEIQRLKQEKAEIDAISREMDKKIKALYAPIVDTLGRACEGVVSHAGKTYKVSYKPVPTPRIRKEDLERLRIHHPDIYKEYVKPDDTRTFKVKQVA